MDVAFRIDRQKAHHDNGHSIGQTVHGQNRIDKRAVRAYRSHGPLAYFSIAFSAKVLLTTLP